ncbi:MAG: tetratricopeptide repeat protein [Pirellula sp.]
MTNVGHTWQLACTLLQTGRLSEAKTHLESVLKSHPDHHAAANLLGIANMRLGDSRLAVNDFLQAINGNRAEASYYQNLSAALISENEIAKAIDACRQATLLAPSNADARFQFACLLEQAGHSEEAMQEYLKTIHLDPQRAVAFRAVGRILLRDPNRLQDSLQMLQSSIRVDPNVPEAFNELGYVLQQLRRSEEAVAAFATAIHLKPNYALAYNNLSTAYRSLRRLDEAEGACRAAIRIDPNQLQALTNLGIVLTDLGRVQEAIACYQSALAKQPNLASAHSRMLFCMQYRPDINASALLAAHCEFDSRQAVPLRSDRPRIHTPVAADRPLRVGLVSDGMARHPVGQFLSSFLDKVSRDQTQIVCYSDRLVEDAVTAGLKHKCDLWRASAGSSHAELAARIESDRIDILYDLDGHAGSRMLLFARKPAPIQISWMGYVGTTGLQAMDYLLADRWQIPISHESYYRERILRMPDGYVCVTPPSQAPEVGELPMLRNGFVTFGCFNQPTKVNERTIATWARIMHEISYSRLRLQYKGYDSPSIKARFEYEFSRWGIGIDRIDLRGNASQKELLSAYNEVDIGLDSFPYSGGLTTCESLWMGVPVVTCPHDTFASRHSLSHLSNIGLTVTIAESLDAYVRIAVELARDSKQLQEMRSRLRLQMSNSPLCDGERFARNWSDLMHQVWRVACETSHSA